MDKSINSGEILFVKSVKDGIPNRDPLNDSDARRLFSEEDGRISLSDVSIKRDVRDFIIDTNPDGGESKLNYIFVQGKMGDKGKLLGRESLAKTIATEVNKEKKAKDNMKSVLIEHCFDVRTFGIVYSVKPKFNLTGPVQFGWAHSLHPVDSQYIQGTAVIPSKDISNESNNVQKESSDTSEEIHEDIIIENEETQEDIINDSDKAQKNTEGKTQGTIWTSYIVPFAIFAMPAIINAKAAIHSEMTIEDQELLLKALWQGTQHRQARGRGQQQPLLLVHIEYNDPFYRIGYLEDLISILPDGKTWRALEKQPSSLMDISLDVQPLLEVVMRNNSKIARCRIWLRPGLNIKGNIMEYEQQPLW